MFDNLDISLSNPGQAASNNAILNRNNPVQPVLVLIWKQPHQTCRDEFITKLIRIRVLWADIVGVGC